MSDVDPRLVSALRIQLSRQMGARVGWKLGIGDGERIGGHIAVGHLTSATVLEPGAVYRGATASLHADAEVAVELGPDGEIAAYAPALELVDLDGPDDPESVVAQNIFHRAVAFGRAGSLEPVGVTAAIVVNGDVRASAPVTTQLRRRLAEARRVLESVGERFEAGDRVITGNVVQVAVEAGDEVVADIGRLGRVGLSIS